jgi:2-polyprenyl-6-methoxyphenol hydroxylase-like FAD-dependent oxidoreductase
MSELRVPVLIAGGSLVGLTTAALLGSHGVPSLVVERHAGTAIHPRAASFHQRTMEIFRALSLQQQVEDAAAREFVQNGAIMAVESLAGKEIAYFQTNYNQGVEELSPTPRLFITQIGLEPLLRDRARELGADVRFNTELVSFCQDDDGVRAVIRDRADGTEHTVRADYLVGADGAHSMVRRQLGIDLAGRGDFARCITIYFRSDVRPMIAERNLSVIYVNHPDFLGFFRFSIGGDAGFLAVFSTVAENGGRNTDVAADTSTERCVAFVRAALGAPDDWPIEIDSVQQWDASASWARRFRDGRVLLAGDAAHVMPPTGGFGGNTGVADAHNLAWKLALVLRGAAGDGLLDSYDAERRPASSIVVEQAYARYVARLDPSLPKDHLAAELDDAAVELGAVCASSAIVAGDQVPPETHNPRTGLALVGARAPHLWLDRNGERISTLDLVDGGFLLLAGSDGADWCRAAEAVGKEHGVPIRAVRVGAEKGEVTDVDGTFGEVYGIGRAGAVLVRPDDVVAWRGAAAAADPQAELAAALSRILAAPVPVA